MKRIFLLLLFCMSSALFLTAQYAAKPASKERVWANRMQIHKLVPGGMKWEGVSGTSTNWTIPAISVDNNGGPAPSAGFAAGGLWLGARDTAGQVRASCLMPYDNLYPFTSGPYAGDWLTDSLNALRWDRFFTVYRLDLERFQTDWSDNASIDKTPAPAILGWPGEGNPYFESLNGFSLPSGKLAPFVDRNVDGIYNPYDGDYPHPAALDPDIVPGQITWNVFNDFYGKFEDVPLGVEVHSTTWEIACEDDHLLNETVFLSFEISNKSGMVLDSMVAAYMLNRFLGYPYSDRLGTYTVGNSMYVYNHENDDNIWEDSNYPAADFGVNPPVAAFSILNKDLYKSIFYHGWEWTDWGYFPGTAEHYFNFLNGRWRNGSPLTYGGSGYTWLPNGIPTDFIFPGHPNNPTDWTDPDDIIAFGNNMYIIPSISLGVLDPGETETLDYAISFHRGPGLNNLQNVDYCFGRIYQLHQLYNTHFAEVCDYTPCTDDCVWPGDMDNNGIVNVRDILPLGAHWKKHGTPREGSSYWGPHNAVNWGNSFNDLFDLKHTDANGDGKLDSFDLNLQLLNFGKKTPSYMEYADVFTTGDEIKLTRSPTVPEPDKINPGEWTNFIIKVGSVPNLAGMAYNAEFDTAYWDLLFYNASSNDKVLRQAQALPGFVQGATVIIDSTYSPWTPNSTLGVFRLWARSISDSLPDTTCIRLKNLYGIRADGSEIPLGSKEFCVCFGNDCPPATRVDAPEPVPLRIYPNPVQDRITVDCPGRSWERIEAFDAGGRLLRIWAAPGSDRADLDTGGLPEGWAVFRVTGKNWVGVSQVLVQK